MAVDDLNLLINYQFHIQSYRILRMTVFVYTLEFVCFNAFALLRKSVNWEYGKIPVPNLLITSYQSSILQITCLSSSTQPY